MSAAKIMLVRHAEKPLGGISGVMENGENNPHALIVRGWQRAGALSQLFYPSEGRCIDSRLGVPNAIFATAVSIGNRSLRPQQTVAPLAAKLGLQSITNIPDGEEKALVAQAIEVSGNVLIAWHHERIPDIVAAFPGPALSFPKNWPDERFDMILVFTPTATGWSLAQVPQLLLQGDLPNPI